MPPACVKIKAFHATWQGRLPQLHPPVCACAREKTTDMMFKGSVGRGGAGVTDPSRELPPVTVPSSNAFLLMPINLFLITCSSDALSTSRTATLTRAFFPIRLRDAARGGRSFPPPLSRCPQGGLVLQEQADSALKRFLVGVLHAAKESWRGGPLLLLPVSRGAFTTNP